MYDVKVGDRVITTVFVCGKQVKMHEAVVIWVSNDGTICKVDTGSQGSGSRCNINYEQCSHLIIASKS